jgi:hypothetical protein
MVFTDLSGILTNSFTLSNDPTFLGKWRVIVSRVTNEIPLCETYFDVVDPASLSIQVLLPNSVTVNQPFQATSRLVNTGGSRVDTAYASVLTLDAGNTGAATFDSGPSHTLVTVEPYTRQILPGTTRQRLPALLLLKAVAMASIRMICVL